VSKVRFLLARIMPMGEPNVSVPVARCWLAYDWGWETSHVSGLMRRGQENKCAAR